MGDGDTVFSLATGRWTGDANITQIGALAADVMARAIVRAATEATGLPNLPAARDLAEVVARPNLMQLALLLLYAVGLTVFGVWIGRRVRGSGDFFVAGRALSAPLLFSTVLAANIGAGTTVGATGLGLQRRAERLVVERRGRARLDRAGVLDRPAHLARGRSARLPAPPATILEHRYGPLVRGHVASLIWLGTLAILAGQLIAGAAVLTVVADVPRWLGVADRRRGDDHLLHRPAACSARPGSTPCSSPSCWSASSSPCRWPSARPAASTAIAATPGLPDTYWNPLHSSGPGSGYAFLALLGPAFIISPGLLQKVYGGDERARGAASASARPAWRSSLFAFVPLLLGMAARTLHPDLPNRDLVLPTMLAESLPWFSGRWPWPPSSRAEVSACDAILFMLSTSLSQDLYKRFVNRQADDAQVLRGGPRGGARRRRSAACCWRSAARR